jgi:hypothetical protein
MPDRFDCELRSIEADRHAEMIHSVSGPRTGATSRVGIGC